MSAGADEGRAGPGSDGRAPGGPAAPGSRLAEMRSARSERAERLARLRGASAAEGPDADDPAALAAFLRALRAAIADAPPDAAGTAGAFAPGPAPAAAAVLPFQRAPDRAAERGERPSDRRAERPPEPCPPGDLDRLPGVGPGLVWALERAGIARLADLAASDPAPLADRLGPVGALIDLSAWIAFAQTATRPATRPETDAPPA